MLAGPVGAADATPLDSLIKHPLQNQWTLWYYDCEKNKSWETCQHQITSFDTVEDFWSLYNHIKPASEIKPGNDYSIFKNRIRPMWEDDTNKNGGRWVITLTKYFRNSDVDSLWLDVVLCLIGEGFDHSEDICGAVVNIRPRGHRIGECTDFHIIFSCTHKKQRSILFAAIWTSNNNEPKIMSIGRKLKESLNIPPQLQINFEFHKDTAYKSGGQKGPAYTV